jgi:branched-chain amino acid transport system ATP-binding protein
MLEVRNLSVRFGGLLALDSATFEVREGEVLSLIGPNGAGKTTAFNAVSGYLAPSGGQILYRGRSLGGLKPSSIAALGLVRTFQKTSLFGNRSALENVLIGLHLKARQTPLAIMLGLPYVAREEKTLAGEALDILKFVDLQHRKDEAANSLPYGEQRLLEVAIALAAKPKLLLLDEPVSGMNPSETASFMAKLGEIRALGLTVLLVEHDMKMVMGVSDRIVCLSQGRIIASGNPAEIRRNPEVIKAYLGEKYARAHA